jgi:hypothetical protein
MDFKLMKNPEVNRIMKRVNGILTVTLFLLKLYRTIQVYKLVAQLALLHLDYYRLVYLVLSIDRHSGEDCKILISDKVYNDF